MFNLLLGNTIIDILLKFYGSVILIQKIIKMDRRMYKLFY